MKNDGKYVKYIKIFFISGLSYLSVINIFYNKGFFYLSVTDLLLIGITYYLGTAIIKERTTNEKLKLHFENLLDKFENMVFDKDNMENKILENNEIDLLTHLRRLNNQMDVLLEYAGKLNVKKELQELKDYYDNLNKKISENTHKITDDVELEVQRIRTIIELKCNKIKFKIL